VNQVAQIGTSRRLTKLRQTGGRPECPLKRGSLITAAEALRALHDVEFGRIEGVIAGGKVKRIIPSYDLRESDSES